MNSSVDTDAILNRLRQEFIDTSLEFLDSIEQSIIALVDDGAPQRLGEIQRMVHTIKGQGSTFGFPAITQIAHRMEDFMEATGEWRPGAAQSLLKFVDALRGILADDDEPDADALATVLHHLPISSREVFRNQSHREVRALLVMPKSTQRKLVAQELTACGFHVLTASTPLNAIATALATPPTIILATEVLEDISGNELLCVFRQIDKTRHAHLALLTSQAVPAEALAPLPDGTVVIHKSGQFHEEMGRHFMDLGLFGKIA